MAQLATAAPLYKQENILIPMLNIKCELLTILIFILNYLKLVLTQLQQEIQKVFCIARNKDREKYVAGL